MSIISPLPHSDKIPVIVDEKLKLNVGAGNWERPGWVNLDYPTEWYKECQSKHKFISYNMRGDKLPYNDNSVDVIYCSHVIEHIEDCYVQLFSKNVIESQRKAAYFGLPVQMLSFCG
jgi:hypothetical protein